MDQVARHAGFLKQSNSVLFELEVADTEHEDSWLLQDGEGDFFSFLFSFEIQFCFVIVILVGNDGICVNSFTHQFQPDASDTRPRTNQPLEVPRTRASLDSILSPRIANQSASAPGPVSPALSSPAAVNVSSNPPRHALSVALTTSGSSPSPPHPIAVEINTPTAESLVSMFVAYIESNLPYFLHA